MKDGKMLKTGGRYEIVNTLGICSLEVAACEMSDAGRYTCIAENSQGTEECICKVTVNGMSSQIKMIFFRVGFQRFSFLSLISTAMLTHDDTIYQFCLSVCLSVRPSVTFLYKKRLLTYHHTFFSIW